MLIFSSYFSKGGKGTASLACRPFLISLGHLLAPGGRQGRPDGGRLPAPGGPGIRPSAAGRPPAQRTLAACDGGRPARRGVGRRSPLTLSFPVSEPQLTSTPGAPLDHLEPSVPDVTPGTGRREPPVVGGQGPHRQGEAERSHGSQKKIKFSAIHEMALIG